MEWKRGIVCLGWILCLPVFTGACNGGGGGIGDIASQFGGDTGGVVCTDGWCSGHGFCEAGVCDCDEGYAGDHCNQCAEGFSGYPACVDDPCEPDPCLGHGFCDGGACWCEQGYAGEHCNQCEEGYSGYPDCADGSCVPVCDGLVCGPDGCGGSCGECGPAFYCNAGKCETECLSDEGCNSIGLIKCLVDKKSYFDCSEIVPGCLKWTLAGECPSGKLCLDDECKDDPCIGVDCSGFGECVVVGSSAKCDCPYGFIAEDLECVSAYSEPNELGVLGGQDDCTQEFLFPFDSSKTLTSSFAAHIADGRPGGVDYAATIGTSLFSPVYGTVEAVNTNAPNGPSTLGSPGNWGCSGSGFGNYVKIRIQYNEYLLLAHMNAGSVDLDIGDVVVPGQKVGEVGNSGYVCSQGGNGAHLHFGYYKSGWVDPSICYKDPLAFGSDVGGIDCHDGDLDTYGVGAGCWKHDCDDGEPLKQSPTEGGCACLADFGDGGDCKDRDQDGYSSGKNCPFFDQDCDDFNPDVHDLCGDTCQGQDCPSGCNDHGSCNGGVCACYQGYKGISCGECAAGYIGYPNCKSDSCNPNPCNGHGSCSDGNCDCDDGYSGTWCDSCAPGYTGYPSCEQNLCAGDPCNGHGSCDDGECDCYDGFDGDWCNQCESGYTGYPNCQPSQSNCPSGNGYYCGGPVGLDSKTLYMCSNGNYSAAGLCGAGCHQAAPGQNDYCEACPSGNGLYCGGPFGLDSDILYLCSGGKFTVNQDCNGSCHVAAPGQNDWCD